MLSTEEYKYLKNKSIPEKFFKQFIGSSEFINGKKRYCLWIDDKEVEEANNFNDIKNRINSVKQDRLDTDDVAVNKLAQKPHRI